MRRLLKAPINTRSRNLPVTSCVPMFCPMQTTQRWPGLADGFRSVAHGRDRTFPGRWMPAPSSVTRRDIHRGHQSHRDRRVFCPQSSGVAALSLCNISPGSSFAGLAARRLAIRAAVAAPPITVPCSAIGYCPHHSPRHRCPAQPRSPPRLRRQVRRHSFMHIIATRRNSQFDSGPRVTVSDIVAPTDLQHPARSVRAKPWPFQNLDLAFAAQYQARREGWAGAGSVRAAAPEGHLHWRRKTSEFAPSPQVGRNC